MNSGDCFACKETLAGVFMTSHSEDILYGYMPVGDINGSFFPSNAMKDKVCWYDLYSNTFPHQASFIRRTLFDTVGLYDEGLKVVSDSRWFAMAVLNYGATCKFLPYKIAIFEGKGLCQTTDFSAEKPLQRKGIFPDYITEEDITNLTIMSLIQSTKPTRFLLKIVKVIAYQIFLRRKRHAPIELYPR